MKKASGPKGQAPYFMVKMILEKIQIILWLINENAQGKLILPELETDSRSVPLSTGKRKRKDTGRSNTPADLHTGGCRKN